MPSEITLTMQVRIRRLWLVRPTVALLSRLVFPIRPAWAAWGINRALGWLRAEYSTGGVWRPLGGMELSAHLVTPDAQ